MHSWIWRSISSTCSYNSNRPRVYLFCSSILQTEFFIPSGILFFIIKLKSFNPNLPRALGYSCPSESIEHFVVTASNNNTVMHCIQNNETDCNIRHLLYSPLLLCSSLLCWHCACAVRDRASVGGLRYYYYGFVYLSMPNLLHSPPKPQLSPPSEKWVVLLCAEKKDI